MALESIQWRATKLVFSLKAMDYEERLRELKLPSLVYRRRRGDVIQMYELMNGLVRMNINALFTPPKVRSTRGHSQKLFKYHATKHSRVNSFTRLINDWNNLPTNVINAPSLNIFKNRTGLLPFFLLEIFILLLMTDLTIIYKPGWSPFSTIGIPVLLPDIPLTKYCFSQLLFAFIWIPKWCIFLLLHQEIPKKIIHNGRNIQNPDLGHRY